MNNQIFVQIASYRDPELLPTIADCIQHAHAPENLTFGIAWQHDPTDTWDHLDPYQLDPRFRIIDIPHTESKGACWARHQIQQLYQNETYTLQLDSHHRFVDGWDTHLIRMLQQCMDAGYPKPLLTAYPPAYHPAVELDRTQTEPLKIVFDRFDHTGMILTKPAVVTPCELSDRPIPARFYSANCTFAHGTLVREVPHDPHIYFIGEEFSIAVRAYTHGYDLFHPNQSVLWHEYTREGRNKHWDDHETWWKIQEQSQAYLDFLFKQQPDVTEYKYGFGTVRTVADYEQYSGVSLLDRTIHPYALQGHLPPTPTDESFIDPDTVTNTVTDPTYTHTIDVSEYIPQVEYDTCTVIFEDQYGFSVHRTDLTVDQINQSTQHTFTITGPDQPVSCIVWFRMLDEWMDRNVIAL